MKRFIIFLIAILSSGYSSAVVYEDADIQTADYGTTQPAVLNDQCTQIFRYGFICGDQFVAIETESDVTEPECQRVDHYGLVCEGEFLPNDNYVGKAFTPAQAANNPDCHRLYQYGYICDDQFVAFSSEPQKNPSHAGAIALVLSAKPGASARADFEAVQDMPSCSLDYRFGRFCNDAPFYGLTADDCQNRLNPDELVDFCLDYRE